MLTSERDKTDINCGGEEAKNWGEKSFAKFNQFPYFWGVCECVCVFDSWKDGNSSPS